MSHPLPAGWQKSNSLIMNPEIYVKLGPKKVVSRNQTDPFLHDPNFFMDLVDLNFFRQKIFQGRRVIRLVGLIFYIDRFGLQINKYGNSWKCFSRLEWPWPWTSPRCVEDVATHQIVLWSLVKMPKSYCLDGKDAIIRNPIVFNGEVFQYWQDAWPFRTNWLYILKNTDQSLGWEILAKTTPP